MPAIAELLEAFLSYLRTKRKAENTIRAYRYDLQLAAAALPQPLEQLQLSQLEAFIDDPQLAPRTSARRASALSKFFVWVLREGYCPTNPLALREAPEQPRSLPRPIERAAHRDLLDAAIRQARPPYKLILTLLRENGLRANEVLKLNRGDVVLDGRAGLRLREPKNKLDRIVPLGPTSTPRSLRELRKHLRETKGRDSDPLLLSPRGTRLTYQALYLVWRELCQALGLADEAGRPRYGLHQLRHTLATEMVEQGHSLETVGARLGHRDPRSTRVYAALSEEQLRDALERQQ